MSGRSSDETYLEAFIESLSTFPAEIKRNLELMKDLDKSGSRLGEEMKRLQIEYVSRVEDKMSNLEVVEGEGIKVLGTDEDRPVVIPTTEELMAYIHDEPDKLARIRQLYTDCLQQSEERVTIADQTYSLVDNICQRIDADMDKLEKLLSAKGDFTAPGQVQPNELAAMQVVAGSATDWILGRVMTHDPISGIYKLSDEDQESNKTFELPEEQVVVLGHAQNLKAGDVVMAVYPETTAFYMGTVSSVPRKHGGGGTNFVMISFMDDHDENGITHDKAVSIQYIFKPQ